MAQALFHQVLKRLPDRLGFRIQHRSEPGVRSNQGQLSNRSLHPPQAVSYVFRFFAESLQNQLLTSLCRAMPAQDLGSVHRVRVSTKGRHCGAEDSLRGDSRCRSMHLGRDMGLC